LASPAFSPVVVTPGPGAPSPAIEIEFATGARMRLMGPVDAATVKVMVAVLAKAQR